MNLNIGFNAKQAVDDMICWLQKYAKENGMRGVVVGNSGGKDCAVVMAVCVKAFGAENVLSVMLPKGEQHDIADAYNIADLLKIRNAEINISGLYDKIRGDYLNTFGKDMSSEASINIMPRLRMMWLTSIGQDQRLRLANTSNASEIYVGYFAT